MKLKLYSVKTRLLLPTVIFLFSTIAATAQVVSLDSLLELVDRQNPMLQEYDLKAKALQEYSAGATSWMAPMVGAGTFMTPYGKQMLMDERDKGSWMFSFEQQIPNPAKLKANKNYLHSRAAIEEKGRAKEFNNLRSEVKTNYYRWLVAEKKAAVLKDNEQIVSFMLKLEKIRYSHNQGNLANIYKTEGRLSQVQNMLLMTRSDIDDIRYRLSALANLDLPDSIRIDTTTVIEFNPTQLVSDTASLSEHRSDIQQINETIQVMQLNQRLQKFQAKPDFKIRFDHMQPIGDMPTQFTAMAMVTIPIAPWSSKMYKAEVKGMHYEIEAMKKGREAILTEARGMIAGMTIQLHKMKQQLDNYNSHIIPSLQKNFETLMIAYEENREQLPLVIDGWEALSMVQMEYLEKMNEYYQMMVKYDKELEK